MEIAQKGGCGEIFRVICIPFRPPRLWRVPLPPPRGTSQSLLLWRRRTENHNRNRDSAAKVINTLLLHCPYFYHRFPLYWRRSGDCPWQTLSDSAAVTLLALLQSIEMSRKFQKHFNINHIFFAAFQHKIIPQKLIFTKIISIFLKFLVVCNLICLPLSLFV